MDRLARDRVPVEARRLKHPALMVRFARLLAGSQTLLTRPRAALGARYFPNLDAAERRELVHKAQLSASWS